MFCERKNFFDLSENNSFRIKARCRKAYFPSSENEIIEIYKSEDNKKIEFLGSGNNIILSKDYYKKSFIIPSSYFNKFHLNSSSKIIEAEAGADLKQLSLYSRNQSLSGLEIFYDIPSSLGGAVVMNAGAGGKEIKDLIIKVRFLDLSNMQIRELGREELEFSYRNSFFQQNPKNIILRAWLQLKAGRKNAIDEEMRSFKNTRWEKQPRDMPNAGSVFKRPEGSYVGPMIEKLGLKGYKIGGAMISEKHGGFIVNHNNATGKDIIDLINYVKVLIKKEFNLELEVEQKII